MTQLVWPNGTTVEPYCTDAYGPRGWSEPGVRAFHTGDDSVGYSTICAIGAGTVIESSYISWAGNQVLLYLGEIDGRRAWVRVCHLESPSHLSRGDQVAIGAALGTMGQTGIAFGVHNHMEMYLDRVDRGGGTGPGDVGTTIDPRPFIRARLAPQSGGLPMFAPYWTGPTTKNTKVSGRIITSYGSFHVPTPQIMNLLIRRHAAALKPGADGEQMLDAEHEILNNFLRACFVSAQAGVKLDETKFIKAINEGFAALGKSITVTADSVDIDPEDLLAALELAVPRIAAAVVKQAGEKLTK